MDSQISGDLETKGWTHVRRGPTSLKYRTPDLEAPLVYRKIQDYSPYVLKVSRSDLSWFVKNFRFIQRPFFSLVSKGVLRTETKSKKSFSALV